MVALKSNAQYVPWPWSDVGSVDIMKQCIVLKILCPASFVRNLSNTGTAWTAIKDNLIHMRRETNKVVVTKMINYMWPIWKIKSYLAKSLCSS